MSKKARQDDDLGTEHLQVTGGVMDPIDASGSKIVIFGAHSDNLNPHHLPNGHPTPAIKTQSGRIVEKCTHESSQNACPGIGEVKGKPTPRLHERHSLWQCSGTYLIHTTNTTDVSEKNWFA